jgi:hypothetical protein
LISEASWLDDTLHHRKRTIYLFDHHVEQQQYSVLNLLMDPNGRLWTFGQTQNTHHQSQEEPPGPLQGKPVEQDMVFLSMRLEIYTACTHETFFFIINAWAKGSEKVFCVE